MAQRLELQALLVGLLGSPNAYFQPPSDLKMNYPCIVYNRDRVDTLFADNHPYRHKKRYQLTIITKEPDSDIPDKVGELPLCSYDRSFTAGKLNHDVYRLYF